MPKIQKNMVHRVDVREPLEKLSLLHIKKPEQSAIDVKKSGVKSQAERHRRWM